MRSAFGMKWILPLALVMAAGIALADDFVTLDGKKHTGTVSRVEPDGIVIVTDDGIEKIPFADLPAAIRQKYGYNPAGAAAFQNAVANAAAQREAEVQQATAQDQATNEALTEQQRATAKAYQAATAQAAFDNPLGHAATLDIAGTVIQRVSDGFIVDARYGKADTVFIEMDLSLNDLFDNSKITTPVVSDGTYDYATTDGSESVIPKLKVAK